MKVATRRHSNFEHQKPSVTLWPKFWWSFSLSIAGWKNHTLNQQLRTGTCRCHCKRFRPHIVMLPGYGFMDGPEDQMRPRPAVCLLRWCWFFWGGWLVRLFQWDFHRLVFGVVYMHDIYIYGRLCIYLQLPGLSPWYFEWSLKKNPKDTEWEKSFWSGMEKKERHLNSIHVSEWLEIPNCSNT